MVAGRRGARAARSPLPPARRWRGSRDHVADPARHRLPSRNLTALVSNAELAEHAEKTRNILFSLRSPAASAFHVTAQCSISKTSNCASAARRPAATAARRSTTSKCASTAPACGSASRRSTSTALDPTDPEKYGKALGRQLANPTVFRALDQAGLSRGERIRLRLVLDDDKSAPHWIRWERLWLPIAGDDWRIAVHPRVAFSRYIAVQSPDGEPPDALAFRLLFAIANPANLEENRRIDVEAEISEVRRGVRERPARSPPAGVGAAGPHRHQRQRCRRGWPNRTGRSSPARRRCRTSPTAAPERITACTSSAHGDYDPDDGIGSLLLENATAAARSVNDPELQSWLTPSSPADRVPGVPQRRDRRRGACAVHRPRAAAGPPRAPGRGRDAGLRRDGRRPRLLLRVLPRAFSTTGWWTSPSTAAASGWSAIRGSTTGRSRRCSRDCAAGACGAPIRSARRSRACSPTCRRDSRNLGADPGDRACAWRRRLQTDRGRIGAAVRSLEARERPGRDGGFVHDPDRLARIADLGPAAPAVPNDGDRDAERHLTRAVAGALVARRAVRADHDDVAHSPARVDRRRPRLGPRAARGAPVPVPHRRRRGARRAFAASTRSRRSAGCAI